MKFLEDLDGYGHLPTLPVRSWIRTYRVPNETDID